MIRDIRIRKATMDDAEWIAPLCHKQFQVAHHGAMLQEDLEYCVDMLFNEPAVIEDIADTTNHYFVAEIDGKPLGCTKLHAVQLDYAKDIANALEVSRVYILPECIGKGVGSALMDDVIEWCRENDITSLWLHVYENNLSAIEFYERWGFEKTTKQDYPVRNSCPVGWVMGKVISLES
jgi:GNAT superfamily N-acetyltransferase